MNSSEQNPEEIFDPREYTVSVNGQTIVAQCDKHLEHQAQWLLETIAGIAKSEPLDDGSTIEVGWTMLVLVRRDENTLIVCEPDFDNDPFEKAVEDVTRSLLVITEQNYVITETHTTETARIPRFDDTVILQKGVLEQEEIYLERNEPSGETDSGWFIGIPDENEDEETELSEDDFEACYVYELVTKRPSLLSVLGLPVGYAVVFIGDDIDAVMDENDTDVWNTENLNGTA